MATYSQTFDEVTLIGRKTCKCSTCGKRLRRQNKFCQTLNPYNCMPNGLPKTREDIMRELRIRSEQWEEEPETCAECQEAAKSKAQRGKRKGK